MWIRDEFEILSLLISRFELCSFVLLWQFIFQVFITLCECSRFEDWMFTISHCTAVYHILALSRFLKALGVNARVTMLTKDQPGNNNLVNIHEQLTPFSIHHTF